MDTAGPPGGTGYSIQGTARAASLGKPEDLPQIGRSRPAQGVADSLLKTEVQKNRNDLLKRLLPGAEVTWGSVTVGSWRGTPIPVE
jgi:hypothetical protein